MICCVQKREKTGGRERASMIMLVALLIRKSFLLSLFSTDCYYYHANSYRVNDQHEWQTDSKMLLLQLYVNTSSHLNSFDRYICADSKHIRSINIPPIYMYTHSKIAISGFNFVWWQFSPRIHIRTYFGLVISSG